MGPAGYMLSTARDMSRWLMMMLNEGVGVDASSTQIVSAEALAALFHTEIDIQQSEINIQNAPLRQAKGWKSTPFGGRSKTIHIICI